MFCIINTIGVIPSLLNKSFLMNPVFRYLRHNSIFITQNLRLSHSWKWGLAWNCCPLWLFCTVHSKEVHASYFYFFIYVYCICTFLKGRLHYNIKLCPEPVIVSWAAGSNILTPDVTERFVCSWDNVNNNLTWIFFAHTTVRTQYNVSVWTTA